MASNAIASVELTHLIARFGIRQGSPGVPAPREWNLATLAGTFAELSSFGETASLTIATSLVRGAQERGEPAAWVAVGDSIFYPPDVAESGVDLEALPVVRSADSLGAVRAADHLLRSGGFALVVVDLGVQHYLRIPLQSRLAGLAKKHHTTLLCLTKKKSETPSIGSLVSIRGEATVCKTSFNRFIWEVLVLKDKRRGPGWSHAEVCRGPDGLC